MSYFCYHGRKRILQQTTSYFNYTKNKNSTTYNTENNSIKTILQHLPFPVLHNTSTKNGTTQEHNVVGIRIGMSRGGSRTTSNKVRNNNMLIRLLHNSNKVDNDNEEQNNNANKSSTSLVEKMLPLKLHPYAKLARVDKPIGTMLLLWPCLWSTALAAPVGCYYPDPYLIGLFSIGSFVMRGAGCTINDMWDSSYDAKVKRTSTRPLANKELTHGQAFAFLTLQLTTGLAILLSLPNTQYCFYLGAASLPLVTIYPLMKRYTNWPQLVLGLTFNWGCFMGWAATYGSLDYMVISPLYLGCICWTLVYDTIYAHQDKQDDAKLGLRSTALFLADKTKPVLYIFSSISCMSWTIAGMNVGYTHPLFFGGMVGTLSHLIWQIYTADLENGDGNLGDKFKSNQYLGFLIFGTFMIGNFFR